MKRLLLLCLLTGLVLFAKAQTATSTALTLVYKDYINGQYQFSVTNNQPCTVNVQVNWNSRSSDSTITIPAGATITIFITAPYEASSTIKAKTADRCTQGANAGYISVPVATTLALRDAFIYTRPRPSDTEFKVEVRSLSGVLLKTVRSYELRKYIKSLPCAVYIIRTPKYTQKILLL